MFIKIFFLAVIIAGPLSLQADSNKLNHQNKKQCHQSAKVAKNINTTACKNSNHLLDIVEKGDVSALKQLIKSKVNINCMDYHTNTPLIIAAKKGHVEIIRLLLLANANLNYVNSKGKVALTYAVMNRNIKSILILLSAKAETKLAVKGTYLPSKKLLNKIKDDYDISSVNIQKPSFTTTQVTQLKLLTHSLKNVNMKDLFSNTLLHIAAEADNSNAIKILLQAKVNVRSVNSFGDTALILAVKNGNTKIVKQLLKASVNINRKNNQGATPLHIAVTHGYSTIVRLLLLNKADVDIVNPLGNSAIHIASSKGYTNLVKQLINAKAKVNIFNKSSDSPLCLAASFNESSVIKLLIAANAKIDTGTRYTECSPINVASDKGHTRAVKVLLAANANIFHEHFSPANAATIAGHVNAFALILNSKSMRQKLSHQYTRLLYKAAEYGRTEIVALILAAKPSKIVPIKTENTPLEVAAYNDRVGVVKLLLASKKYPSNANSATKALLYAMTNEYVGGSIIMPLIAAKANINATDSKGNTPLHMIIPNTSEYRQDVIKIVLQAKPDINKRNRKGLTPLMLSLGDADIAYIILGAKAKINQVVKIKGKNVSALSLARKKGYTRTIKLLKEYGAK
ncbi:hypothetical protein MNBD_GAMMA12-3491 [hydrothermal vent metagenome]|uniref:Uncharacterized protein n=2 Tax=hydrothermal vent metagenome TaxID=652676 RepID=A0A3B0YZ69_9ZZZZ